MNRFNLIVLPLALLFGACDSAEDIDEAAEANVEGVAQAPASHGKRGGRMARLDADKDGAISIAEARDTRLAANFARLDGDGDGKLTRDELRAMKGRGEGRGDRGGHMKKDPVARAAKLLEKRDADKNGALSPAELQGSRMAERFAAVDTDKNGALSRDELVAFRPTRGRGGPQH